MQTDLDVADRRQLYSGFGDSLVRAVEFAAMPLLFGWIGHFLDGRLGTNPWLTIFLVVFALTGLVIRMYYGYVAAMEAHEAAAPWAPAARRQALPAAPGEPGRRSGDEGDEKATFGSGAGDEGLPLMERG